MEEETYEVENFRLKETVEMLAKEVLNRLSILESVVGV